MANDNDKNFSEQVSKIDTSNKLCQLCEEPIPKLAIHFSNQIAIESGYCCWICMLSHMGGQKAYAMLQEKVKELKEKRINPFGWMDE